MFFSTGLEQVDPAMLAFVKCHVTSPLKWEVLRVLAQAPDDGSWVGLGPLARAVHKSAAQLNATLDGLVSEGIVEGDGSSYRLPPQEATSVVLRRLIEVATHSQELRAIIVANLQRSRFAPAAA
jgi:predicted exporter